LTEDVEIEFIPSLVEIIFTEILLAAIGVIRLSIVGFGADAVSVSIRFRRTDEPLDGRFPSEELFVDEFSNSSVFFINKGLFN
jgi:hypothetical protein